MALRVLLMLLFVSLELPAQQARSKASDYPAHSKLSTLEIAAEYLPHGIPGVKSASAGKEYLVVEVGLFPSKAGVAISKSQFTLRVDGGRELAAQSPGSSAAPPKSSDIQARSNSSSKSGSVELGGPPLSPSFPSDGHDSQAGLPRRPIVLDESGDAQKNLGAPRTSLPEGPLSKPVRAYLYFRFDGDAKSIHSLELVYDAGAQKARLRLL